VACRAERVPTFGGSLRLFVRRAQDGAEVDASIDELLETEGHAGLDRESAMAGLAERGRLAAAAFREQLASAPGRGVSIAGYGAPSKAAVLMSLADVDASLLPYTVDLAPAKHGRRIPGARVPIRPVEELIADRPGEVIVLTWDIAAEVVIQLQGMARDTGWSPRFWVPLPKPGYITA